MLNILMFIGNLGSGELLLILLVCLILFGTKRIPELARALGKGIQEFKKATQDVQEDKTTKNPEHTQDS
jgi:sec-independent protein translocase protein TatA